MANVKQDDKHEDSTTTEASKPGERGEPEAPSSEVDDPLDLIAALTTEVVEYSAASW